MNNLKQIINEKGIKNSFIAKKLNISPALLSRYIKGDRRITLERARIIADLLNTTIEDIFFNNDNLNNNNKNKFNIEQGIGEKESK